MSAITIGQMKKFCEKAIWIEFGQVKMEGSIKDVIPAYEKIYGRLQKGCLIKRKSSIGNMPLKTEVKRRKKHIVN